MKQELINRANNNIRIAREYIEANRPAFECMNLKLYDAFYYSMDIEKDYPELDKEWTDYFYDFCELEYDLMIEHFKMNGWDFDKRKYIGRTSSFYLSETYYMFGAKDELNDIIYTVLDNCGWYMDVYPELENDHIIPDDDAIANTEYIASQEFIDDLKKELAPIIGMYTYIKAVKDNQLDNFKCYLEDRRADILYEREQETEHNLTVWLAGVEKIIA